MVFALCFGSSALLYTDYSSISLIVVAYVFSFSGVFFARFMVIGLVSFSFAPLVPAFPRSMPPYPTSGAAVLSSFSTSPVISVSSFGSFYGFFRAFRRPTVDPIVVEVPVVGLVFLYGGAASLRVFCLCTVEDHFLACLLFGLRARG